MNKRAIELTDEKFQEVYTNEKFRNAVAYAHGVKDSSGSWLKAMMYPIDYKVTEKQKDLANAEVVRAKEEKLKALDNKLVFVGMGMTYDGDNVGNYRIRTEFRNSEGLQFFIEFSSAGNDDVPKRWHIDHAIYREKRYMFGEIETVSHNHYKKLEGSFCTYTKESILNFINKHFGCRFQEIEIDNYTLNTADFVCQSPEIS